MLFIYLTSEPSCGGCVHQFIVFQRYNFKHYYVPCDLILFNVSGRKEGGEEGIMFDNEEEKEQWEEDQKVSILLNIRIIDILHYTGEFP